MKKAQKQILLFAGITAIIAIIFLILFAIRKQTKTNGEATGGIEINYRVAERSEQACVEDGDCETPMSYLMQSNCPYTSKCLEKACAVICPDVDPKWREVQKAINNCEVKAIFQNHQNEVEATLRDGTILKAIEPNIDVIFDVVTNARSKCGEIQMATE